MIERMGAKRAGEVQKHMESVGNAEGIIFNFRGRTGNSRMSHLLMHVAGLKSSEVQCTVAEELFKAHFEEARDIADLEVLGDVADRAGLGRTEMERYFESTKEGISEIDEEARRIRDSGIKGVPHIIFEDGPHFDGAVDVQDVFEALVSIKT